MEIALRQVDPTIAIPYWDSSLEAQLPTPADSHLFTKEFMGSTDEQGNLVYGHFANWKTIDGNPNIRRRVGRDGKGFTEDEINWFLNQVQIDQIMTYSAPQPGVCAVRMEFRWMEITHGNVHLFVGGSFALPNGTDEADGDMAEQTRSANDPIFFMHHSFVDYVWEMWRQSKQTRENREKEYPMDNAQCASPQHFGSAPMRPFEPWQNRDGLNNKYTDNMFEYAPRPTCQMGPNCGSKLLFCDRSHGQPPHCAAKVRPGGNCTGFINGEDVCLNGMCQNGKCRQTNNDNYGHRKGECQQNQGYIARVV
uniref:Tyrosinase_Cu-bd domain-containing protein n=1 Tax=Globodera pallida TaxID=36090 RepID=A0A183BKG6_GLOPA